LLCSHSLRYIRICILHIVSKIMSYNFHVGKGAKGLYLLVELAFCIWVDRLENLITLCHACHSEIHGH
jgi:hypothetical protein